MQDINEKPWTGEASFYKAHHNSKGESLAVYLVGCKDVFSSFKTL